MRLHRFFIQEEIKGKEIIIREERLLHQWKNVFRMGSGDRLVLFNGRGKDFVCVINSLGRGEASIAIVDEKENKFSLPKLHLYFSLLKKDNSEWVIEKGTELGVFRFTPFISERSEKTGFNMERAQKIAIEASEQSNRGNIPFIDEPIDFKKALESLEIGIVSPYLFDPTGENLRNYSFSHDPIAFFIGPEGGFSDKELYLAKEKKIPILSLGSQIFRAETSSIVASALVLIG